MTEIPEHLLKRAKERRAALGGESGEAASDAPAASSDAPSAAAAPVPAAKAPKATPLPTLARDDAPPPPDTPVVAAAKRRRRVPFWAAPVLASLPLWALIYVNAVQAPPGGETDPIAIGSELFGQCAGCHGADGAGSAAGQQLNEGHTIETFSDPLSMAHWISFGSDSVRDDGTYGDLDRPGGAMNTSMLSANMPGFAGTLTPEEIAALVIYVRSEFSDDLYDPEAEQGFTAEAFEEDPGAFATLVEEVEGLGPDGIDEVETIERPGS